MHTCLNCGAEFSGKYCPECGQKAHVHRLTAKALLDEILHFFTHIEHTFLKTSLHFIIKPGITSLNYVKGKRKRYQKPVSYFLIWAGFYILLHNFILNYFHYDLVLQETGQTALQQEANIFLRKHFSFFVLPVLLTSSFWIWLVLGRGRLFFFEIFTLSLYGCGCYFVLLIISDLVLGVVFRVNINHYYVFFWQTILSFLYNTWFTVDLFRRLKLRFFVARILLASALISLAGYFIFIYGPELWIYLFK